MIVAYYSAFPHSPDHLRLSKRKQKLSRFFVTLFFRLFRDQTCRFIEVSRRLYFFSFVDFFSSCLRAFLTSVAAAAWNVNATCLHIQNRFEYIHGAIRFNVVFFPSVLSFILLQTSFRS